MKTGIILQARTGSKRLPNKVVLPFYMEEPMLLWQLKRLDLCREAAVIVATTLEPRDDIIAKIALKVGASVWRGSEEDVLARYYDAARAAGLGTIVRITGDCPLVDPRVVDALVMEFHEGGFEYVSNAHPQRTVPAGFDVEVFSRDALALAHFWAIHPNEREHVTPYFYGNALAPDQAVSRFVVGHPGGGDTQVPRIRLKPHVLAPQVDNTNFSVDTQEDFDRVSAIFAKAYEKYGIGFTWQHVLEGQIENDV